MYLILGIVLVCLAGLTLAARLEKRMVWPYTPPEAKPQLGPPSPYALDGVQQALQLGFSFLGWVADAKGPKYRVTYALLVSPERDSLAVIGAGKVHSFDLKGTWIHTPIGAGRSLYSADNQSCVEVDISRAWVTQLVPGRKFSELWRRHHDWDINEIQPISSTI